jgi:integrase
MMRRWGKRRLGLDPGTVPEAPKGAEPVRYHGRDAGKTLFRDFAEQWLSDRADDPCTMLRYEVTYRLHVSPAFARRRVRVIRPSQVQVWLSDLSERFGPATVAAAFLILQGVLDLAVAEHAIETNPARSVAVRLPAYPEIDIQAWDDAAVAAVIAAHPGQLRLVPELAASCGMRDAEVFGLGLEDFDFEERIVRVRRQIARAARVFVFAPPECGRDRVIPLSGRNTAQVRLHIDRYPPRPYTLPWLQKEGEPRTCHLMVRWPADDQHVKARNYAATVWRPAVARAGIAAGAGGGGTRFDQLRRYYASVMLAGGVSIGELAEYLGADQAATLCAYAHLLPSAHDRARAAADQKHER